jgi:rod shape-determining protein MreC
MLYPIHLVANFPIKSWMVIRNKISVNSDLIKDNKNLENHILDLKVKLQKQEYIFSQNILLQEVLHASKKVKESFLLANIIGLDPKYTNHKVIINQGEKNKVSLGQAVIDATGIFGQIVEVNKYYSRVVLISDKTTRISIENNRTKFRAIASGIGDYTFINILQVPKTTDFKTGDLIVSSGIDGVYPAGYPVGKVEEITRYDNNPFLVIRVRLSAKLELQQPVLVVFSKNEIN